MPRLRSWADWYHAYPMPPEMVAENIKYTMTNSRNFRLLSEELKFELAVMNFNIKVRDFQATAK